MSCHLPLPNQLVEHHAGFRGPILENAEQRLQLARRAEAGSEALWDNLGQARALYQQGEALTELGHFDDALATAAAARDHYREGGSQRGEAQGWELMAFAQRFRDLPQAVDYARKAQDLHEKAGRQWAYLASTLHVGNFLLEQEQPRAAKRELDRAAR